MDIDAIVKVIVDRLMAAESSKKVAHDIPVGVSNRHVHLSLIDFETLFGKGASLNKYKDLTQPGQYASTEFVTLVGTKGCIERVRILGPLRAETQVEILLSDSYKLGVDAPVRESGKLEGTPGIAVVGPYGCVQLKRGVIAAMRHIHMGEGDALRCSLKDGDIVSVMTGGIRGAVLDNVLVRVSDKYILDFHIDIDEANCLKLKDRDLVRIVAKN